MVFIKLPQPTSYSFLQFKNRLLLQIQSVVDTFGISVLLY